MPTYILYKDPTILVRRKIKSHFYPGRLFYESLRGSMTDPPHSTMAASEATTPSHVNQTVPNAPTNTTTRSATKNLVTQDFDLTIRAFFPAPTAPTKFNPIHVMNMLFCMMLKDKPSLVLCTPSNDKQLILALGSILTGESKFKKYFKVSTTHSEKQNSLHICTSCHVVSNCSLGNIKFNSTDSHLLAWLKKEWVFLESDGLGTNHLVTIGYFTKIAADITHLANFHNHLVNQFMLVELEVDTRFFAKRHGPLTQPANLWTSAEGQHFFLTTMAMLPINLEYNACFASLTRQPHPKMTHFPYMNIFSINHGFCTLKQSIITNVLL